LLGGWIAARSGLKVTLYGGLLLQIAVLIMLAFLQPAWARLTSVAYVMAAQALSDIAKDLTKMSAKSAIKVVVPEGEDGALFKWGRPAHRFEGRTHFDPLTSLGIFSLGPDTPLDSRVVSMILEISL
jgi:hypothetical protein